MNELSLFTGAGGGILGSRLLGWRTVGYVEREKYPQRVIKQRIADGIYDEAPIFSNIKTFTSEGYARKYRNVAKIISAGFPCQPFSVAGSRKASNDERNLWPDTLEVIKEVDPAFVYLENVPGLLSATVGDGPGRLVYYFGVILRELAELGYCVRWTVLGADFVGGIHTRKRLWVLGVKSGTDTERARREKQHVTSIAKRPRYHTGLFAQEKALPRGEVKPELVRVLNDVANRGDRLRAIGNGQVSLTMVAAYEILFNAFINDADDAG